MTAGISRTTPEPRSDLAAQVAAVHDPASTKDAAFVAAGNQRDIPIPLPPGIIRVDRAEGTLLTTNPLKARQFRARTSLSDTDMAAILGYPETKASAIAFGSPRVVQGTDANGSVVTAMLASPGGIPAASHAAALQAPNAPVSVVSAVDAQRRRAAVRGAGLHDIHA